MRPVFKIILIFCTFMVLGSFSCRRTKINTITVGSKHFTEQEILGEIISILIEENTDLKVVRRFNLGGTMICFNALKAGDIDLYAEYTGTGLVNILKQKAIKDPAELCGAPH
jgi:glycine betaine/choline ABC-type transport system substrate-binding protein